jgi:hypothetical protein
MLNKKIQVAPAVNIENITAVNFDRNEFQYAIEQKGYTVFVERAIKCPCRSFDSGGNPLTNCRNCGGIGLVFLNKIQTKAIIHSMNLSTQFKEWSEEKIGNASISVNDTDRLSFMDKVTVRDAEVEYSQNIYPRTFMDKVFAYTVYDIKSVTDLYLFEGEDKPLKRLEQNQDFTFEYNRIYLNEQYSYRSPLQLSIRYVHAPTFHIMDMVREAMVSTTNIDFKDKSVNFPVSYVGRRAHDLKIFLNENLAGTYIFDNSYYKKDCK